MKISIQTAAMLIAGALILCFASCTVQKQAAKHTYKALGKDTTTVLSIVDKLFPNVPGEIKHGDSTNYLKWKNAFDSLLNIEPPLPPEPDTVKLKADAIKCPDQNKQYEYYKAQFEAVNGRLKSLRDSLKTMKPITDTIPVPDSRRERILQGEKDAVIKERDQWKAKAEKRGSWNWWLIVICLVLLIGNILQAKFKK